jgi:hypothetical protein
MIPVPSGVRVWLAVGRALIEAATAYEVLFVPALFRQWAPIVADAAHIKSGDRVLDVACGTDRPRCRA